MTKDILASTTGGLVEQILANNSRVNLTMNVNTAEGGAADILSSTTGCILYAGDPRPSKTRLRCSNVNVNIANLNSDEDTARLCKQTAALVNSHITTDERIEMADREISCEPNELTKEVNAYKEMSPKSELREKALYADNHSTNKLGKLLEKHNSLSTDYDRNDCLSINITIEPNCDNKKSSKNEIKLKSSNGMSHNLSVIQSRLKASRDIKIHNDILDALNFKCKELPTKDVQEETTEVDKNPWTMAVSSVCVRVVFSVFTMKPYPCRRMLVVLMTVAAALACASAAPTRGKRDLYVDDKTQNYLMKFGYLPQSSIEVGNLIMEDQLQNAIRNLQAFGGIPATGEVDEATKELLNRRRCGMPDQEEYKPSSYGRSKRFVIQGAKWNHTDLTWSLSPARRPSSLEAGHTRTVLSRALSVWSQHSKLTFREIASEQADIVVSFSRGYHDDAYPFDGRGHILAHAFFPGSGRGGDAHFDDDELWVLQPKDTDEEGTSLFAVAAHEFGHSLGLSHSSVKGALMYPWYQGILPNFTLMEDDRNGIQQMYGPRERRIWGQLPKYHPAAPPTTTTTTTSTTTRRPHHHHHDRDRYPYDPYHPQTPTHPHRPPNRPERPTYPQRPDYDPNRRRYYNATEYNPRRTHYDTYPRQTPTLPETTTQPYYPRRPNNPGYPSKPDHYPRRPEYYPTKTENPRKTDYYPTKSDNPTKTDYPRKPTQKKPTYPEKNPVRPSEKPDTCDTSYDAVALLRGEVFIFKDRWHWRIGSKGLVAGYPIEILRMWKDLPKNLTRVDAVYERPDRKIAFFVGKEYYLFDADHLVYGYPKPLTHLWLPESLLKLDAAMVWGHNGKTYFYSGSMYWKFDEDEGHVELDYPRDMSMWKGVGYDIDSVFQWKDGKTYFFKGKGYWKFNDLQMRVEKERQMPSGPFWMGCPAIRSEVGNKQPYNADPPTPTSTLLSSRADVFRQDNVLLVFILSLLVLRLSFNIT